LMLANLKVWLLLNLFFLKYLQIADVWSIRIAAFH
jgi:hypothetical protein